MLRRTCTARALGFFNRVAVSTPHPKKITTGGEDAYFADDGLLAVADGVGEWSTRGVDAGAYSKTLMRGLYEYLEESSFHGFENDTDPLMALKYATELASQHRGSSTAILAAVNGSNLSVLNVGDCSVMLLRNSFAGLGASEVVFRSEEMQHSFNYPFQLGSDKGTDQPEAGERHEIAVQSGDLAIMGTDGVFDNLYDEEMVDIIVKELANVSQKGGATHVDVNRAMEKAATAIVLKATANTKDKAAQTPIWEKAMQQGMLMDGGGKPDDMTLVIGLLQDRASVYGGHRTNCNVAPPPPPYTAYGNELSFIQA